MKVSPLKAMIPDHVVDSIATILLKPISNTDIDRILSTLGLRDMAPKRQPWTAKKERIYVTLVHYQRENRSPRVVHLFIEEVVRPGRYTSDPSDFNRIVDSLNEQLAFVSLQVSRQGEVVEGKLARTLDEAALLADSMIMELQRRHVHPQVLRACDKELLQKNLFHGLLEANKSVADRLRSATGVTGDGAPLADKVLGAKSGTPLIAINSLQTETERSTQSGFCNLIKGCFSIWRNLTAHELRRSTELERQNVLDALTTLSYIHSRLDEAIVTSSGERIP